MNKIFITTVILFYIVLFSGCIQSPQSETIPNYNHLKIFLTEEEVCKNLECRNIKTLIEQSISQPMDTNAESRTITFENKHQGLVVPEEMQYNFYVIQQTVSNCLTVKCAKKVLAGQKKWYVDRQLNQGDGTLLPLDGVGNEAYIYKVDNSGTFFIIVYQNTVSQSFYFNVSYPDKVIPIAKTLVQQGLDKQLRINNI